jgi:hypothetical protein
LTDKLEGCLPWIIGCSTGITASSMRSFFRYCKLRKLKETVLSANSSELRSTDVPRLYLYEHGHNRPGGLGKSSLAKCAL